MRTRHTFVATGAVALLAAAGVTAAIAADPAPPPPPRIAFVANGIVPADALAAGPIAGQLGAPIYTTRQDVLSAGTADALTAYNPELVIVMGGPVAISDAVVTQVAAATGLAAVDPSPTPDTGVVRAAGGDRFETATIVADLLAAYAPAHLPVDAQAVDADLLDGMDSSAFLGAGDTAADADTLDGLDSSALVEASDVMTARVDGDTGSLLGGDATSATRSAEGTYSVFFSRDVGPCTIISSAASDVASQAAHVGTETSGASPMRVGVRTYEPDTPDSAAINRLDADFHLLVVC